MRLQSAVGSVSRNEFPAAQWTDLLAMTGNMLQAAHEGDWDRVRELESMRRPLLQAVLARPTPAADSIGVANNVEEILDMDAEIMELGARELEGLQAGLAKLRNAKVARLAYTAE